jgi:purine-binding chemotaxis protein CheW
MAMSAVMQLLVFRLDNHRYALPLAAVERIVRAAEVTPLPDPPRTVFGVLDVAGAILPVLNLRRRFQLPERDIQVSDQFLIARTPQRSVILVIDVAEGIVGIASDEIVSADAVFPGLDQVRGVARMKDGLVLIHDLPAFFSLGESMALDEALRAEMLQGT